MKSTYLESTAETRSSNGSDDRLSRLLDLMHDVLTVARDFEQFIAILRRFEHAEYNCLRHDREGHPLSLT